MKTLKKITLAELGILPSDILNKKAQKYILGGERDHCCYSEHWEDPEQFPCDSPRDCMEKAGTFGWWGCNGAYVTC